MPLPIVAGRAAGPADYLSTVAAAADQISADGQEPGVLRDLATCVRTLLSNRVPQMVSPSALSVAYLCGNTFRVANTSTNPALATYHVENTTETGDIAIPANGPIDVGTIIFWAGSRDNWRDSPSIRPKRSPSLPLGIEVPSRYAR